MPKFELHRVGFVNPADPSETVSLSTILEGAGGATRAFVEEESESYVIEENQEIKDSQVYTFTMAGRPNDELAQLTSWADDATPLTIVGYAYNQWLYIENAFITRLQDSSERLVWKITARKAGGVDYVDGKLDTEFMMSQNLLNMYKWEDGGSGIAAGWAKTGGTTSFSSGTQTFSTSGATDLYLYRDLYLPLANEIDITFFFNVTALTVNDAIRLSIVELNDSGNPSGTPLVAIVDSTGLVSRTIETSEFASAYRFQVQIGENDSVTFENPGINKGTSTEYIAR